MAWTHLFTISHLRPLLYWHGTIGLEPKTPLTNKTLTRESFSVHMCVCVCPHSSVSSASGRIVQNRDSSSGHIPGTIHMNNRNCCHALPPCGCSCSSAASEVSATSCFDPCACEVFFTSSVARRGSHGCVTFRSAR